MNAPAGLNQLSFPEASRFWREIRSGLFLGLTSIDLAAPLPVVSRTFPAICLSVVLDGLALDDGGPVQAGFCPDERWVSATGESLPTAMTILPERPVRVVELLVTPTWIAAEEADDPVVAAMARAMEGPVRIRRLPLTADLRDLCWSALRPALPGRFARLHEEAVALQMLGVLAAHFRPQEGEEALPALSPRAVERINRLCREIDLAPGREGTAALARRFGIGETTLRREFRQAHGRSLRDYIAEKRMLAGRNAILSGGMTVAQAAWAAGYDHAPNFTAAFTRHFGYPPASLKNHARRLPARISTHRRILTEIINLFLRRISLRRRRSALRPGSLARESGGLRMRGDRPGWAALAGVGLALGVAPGIARAEGEPILLEEIVISAQKRPQDLAEIPASVSLVEGGDLSPAGARREDEFSRLPNLDARQVTARLYTSFVAIRGVGSALIESDPAVGLTLDGISLGSSQAFSGSLLDVDRIEVMRGPQGTLYGRNALGGAINVVSNRPDPEVSEGRFSLGFGSEGRREVQATANAPLGGGWAARGALSANDWDSERRSSITGGDLGGGETGHGRLGFAGPLSEKVDFYGFVDLERQKLTGESFGMPIADWRAGSGLVALDDPSRISSDSDLLGAALTWRLENGDRIETQTGWQESRAKVSGNGFPQGYFAGYDAMFAPYLPGFRYRSGNPFDGSYRQISKEIRYLHEGGRLDWVLGFYGEAAKADRAYGATSSFTGGEMALGSRGVTKTSSLSIFADGDLRLSDRWSLFGGLRLGHDRKTFDYAFSADATAQALGFAAPFEPAFSDRFSKTYATPRLGFSYQAAPETLLWASVSSGYKSGGFNAGFVGAGDAGHYEPERLTAWEIGFRSEAMDRRLRLDGAVFLNDWRDQQVQAFDASTGATPILNAPKSRSMGAELSARLDLDNGLGLRGALGYVDATYEDFPNAPAPGGVGSLDVSGRTQQFVSGRTASLGLDYAWAMAGDWSGRADLTWRWNSGYWFDASNTIRQPAFALLDASASFGNGRYEVTLWGKNLTDEDYLTAAGDLGGGLLATPGEGRSFGVNLTAKF